MEPWARLNTYAHQIDRGKPFIEPLEHDAGINPFPTLNVQLWESVDDVSTNELSECQLGPWFLPKPWSIT
jgi:hypothetical protein